MVRSWAEVDETIIVTILARNSLKAVVQRTAPLQLSTPESTEVAVYLSIVVLKHTRVDGERATDREFLRNERTFGLVCHSNAKTEHTTVFLCREDEIVLAVLLNDIVVPHLLLSPWHVLNIEDNTVVGNFAIFNIVP